MSGEDAAALDTLAPETGSIVKPSEEPTRPAEANRLDVPASPASGQQTLPKANEPAEPVREPPQEQKAEGVRVVASEASGKLNPVELAVPVATSIKELKSLLAGRSKELADAGEDGFSLDYGGRVLGPNDSINSIMKVVPRATREAWLRQEKTVTFKVRLTDSQRQRGQAGPASRVEKAGEGVSEKTTRESGSVGSKDVPTTVKKADLNGNGNAKAANNINGSTAVKSYVAPQNIDIVVKDVLGGRGDTLLSVSSSATVGEIKGRLSFSLPDSPAPHRQRLVARGRALNDNVILAHLLLGQPKSSPHLELFVTVNPRP
mmetsp:Transcript_34031/g.53035  ORF Transcript_34031/g.53035 Transcript_34031/m.53035 type:complete len:318 (+) Transcript_34031:408-1361(+)